jgi:protein-S-isoprenylcysteine O-methyltransferase Ste14
MGKIKELTGKVIYGLLFLAVVPLLLILWAKYTDKIITLPLPETLIPGFILLIAGVLFVLTGMWNLWRFGKGLPMNAFPPERFVKNGIFAITKHPIYSGAVMISFGFSVIVRSASGFWLVSPLFSMMIVAFVVGFENEKTQSVFGEQDYKPFLLSRPEIACHIKNYSG